MIIESLMNLIYKLITSIFSGISVPVMDSSFESSLTEFLSYIGYGSTLFKLVLPINFTVFFVLFFAIFAVDKVYPFIMWVLRKIPFVDIK